MADAVIKVPHSLDQYHDLQAQGFSLRQAAKALHVPRSTLQAWRAYQESLDEHPAVVAFFQSWGSRSNCR